jgi:hypothetical protein
LLHSAPGFPSASPKYLKVNFTPACSSRERRPPGSVNWLQTSENEGCAGIGANASRFVPSAAQAAECQTSAPAEHATIRQTTPPPQTAPRNRMSVLSTGNRIVDES